MSFKSFFKNSKFFWNKPTKRNNNQQKVEGEAQDGSPGLLAHDHIKQPDNIRFEDANPWTPEKHTLMYCMNGQDNVPTRIKHENGFVYYVSQNRSPGHKDQGQDCMATATQDNWQIQLLCDGHDKAGHMVALGICQQLPKIVLRKIKERADLDASMADEPVTDAMVNESFDECAKVVCWTKEGITVGLWVKVFEGQWADKPGFIKESNGPDKVKVAIIDENGYHLPTLNKSDLRRPRYTGGCTCILMMRNLVTKECKVAVTGDSRMIILPTMGVNDAVLLKQPGVEEGEEPVVEGLITPAHNVFNEDEKERLERDFSGQYEFDGNFLVNPITKFAIQPTRGFGDFDMFGTGYTHRPEITKTFKVEPNGLIFTASDGVFDEHVWSDEELVSCLDNFIKDGLTNVQIIDRMYRETLERSLEGGYVDDISIYVFQEPPEEQVPEVKAEVVETVKAFPNEKTVKKKKNTKKNRRTIERGAATFTAVSEKLQKLKEQKELTDVAEVEDAEVKGEIEGLASNLATSHKVEINTSAIITLDEDKKEDV